MSKLILKDLLLQKKMVLLLFFYIVFFMITFNNLENTGPSAAVVAVTYMLISTAAAQDDKNKAEIMLNSLPIQRKEVVRAKYISIFIFMGLGIFAYVIIGEIIKMTQIPLTIQPITTEQLIGTFLAITLLNSIFFPAFFRFGYMKTRFLNIFLFLGFFFGVTLVINFTDRNVDVWWVQSIMEWFNQQNVFMIEGMILASGLFILLLSYFISVRIYEKKEFL